MSLYLLYRVVAGLSRALPLKIAYWVGLRTADCFYWMKRKDREAIIANLRTIYAYRNVLPAEQAFSGFARKCFQYFGKNLVDFFRYSRLTPADVHKLVGIENPQCLQDAAALKRGVILVTAHFGNWEMGAAVLAALGHRVHAIVLPQPAPRLNHLFQSQREQHGVRVMLVGSQTIRKTINLLKQGEWVAILGDRDFVGQGCPTTFFGKVAYLPRGPAWLARLTNAAVLVGFLIRQVDDTFLLRMFPPILPENEPSENALRARITALMEREIGERPYQWFMFRDFWKLPPGDPDQEVFPHE